MSNTDIEKISTQTCAKNGRALSTFNHWKGKSRYRKHRKILTVITEQRFKEIIENGRFLNDKHKAFFVLIYYTGIRKQEALRALGKNFSFTEKKMIFEVGKRLKHGIETPPLPLPLDLQYMDLLVDCIKKTNKDAPIFDFSPMTAYNIFDRLGVYPHFYRLNRITNFFLEGWTIPQVHSWTGLSLKALDFYLGLVDIEKMGESLGKK